MGATLNLSECLLAMGREMQAQGRSRDALKLFTRLSTFRDLAPDVSEEVRARLADLLIADKQFAKARRILSVLMCSHPNEARHFYRFARALHRDQKADPHRAAKYYQQALDLDPAQPKWWSAYGKLLAEIGRFPEAVAAHKRALELANNEPALIKRTVEALCLNDHADDARQLLLEARFRNPRDPRFRKLWNDFQISQAIESQGPRSHAEPVILPFVRLAGLPRKSGLERLIIKLNDARPTPTPKPRWSANHRDR